MRSWREPSASIMVTVASMGESRVWRTFVCPVEASMSRVSWVRMANGEGVVVVGMVDSLRMAVFWIVGR